MHDKSFVGKRKYIPGSWVNELLHNPGSKLPVIIESVDSICRDSMDMQYMIIQKKNTQKWKVRTYVVIKAYKFAVFEIVRDFLWWTTCPVVCKSIAKVPNQKVARQPKCFSFFFFFFFFFFFRQGISNCVTLSQWFSHKTATFYTKQCTSPFTFSQLWSLMRCFWASQRRNMASS